MFISTLPYVLLVSKSNVFQRDWLSFYLLVGSGWREIQVLSKSLWLSPHSFSPHLLPLSAQMGILYHGIEGRLIYSEGTSTAVTLTILTHWDYIVEITLYSMSFRNHYMGTGQRRISVSKTNKDALIQILVQYGAHLLVFIKKTKIWYYMILWYISLVEADCKPCFA